MPLTYSRYLKIDELLDLQQPLSDGPEHDETLFIIIHQVYELWFKEVLHELDQLTLRLGRDDPPGSLHTLTRILAIWKVMVAQLDVLETMTPLEFLTFRDRLESSSGFQSFQFRELEFALGSKNPQALERFPLGSPARARLEKRFDDPSLWSVFLRFLGHRGYDLPRDLLEGPVQNPTQASAQVQQVLIRIYREDPLLSQLCERLTDLDEGIQEWRYRHVKMVERTLGNKPGTGGSPGVDYLKKTLFAPLFPDLWAIRSEL